MVADLGWPGSGSGSGRRQLPAAAVRLLQETRGRACDLLEAQLTRPLLIKRVYRSPGSHFLSHNTPSILFTVLLLTLSLLPALGVIASGEMGRRVLFICDYA